MSPKQEINELLTKENVIKLCGLLVGLTLHYAAIRSDIREINTEKKYEVEHLQYQITELKDCCNDKQNKRIAFRQSPAILPHEIEMKEE